MKHEVIIFDLDDTLIDTKPRHFKVVNDYLNQYGKGIGFSEYLDLRKKRGMQNRQIVHRYLGTKADEFSLVWERQIESRDYLKNDVPLVDYQMMADLKRNSKADFVLISLRSNADTALHQVSQFTFFELLDELHFLKHASVNPKIELLKIYKSRYETITFVSDSQDDCAAALTAGVEFVGVRTGVYELSCKRACNDINTFLLTHTL